MSIFFSFDLSVVVESSALPVVMVLVGCMQIKQRRFFVSAYHVFYKLYRPLQQEENLRRAKKGDLKVSVHRMEMERIRYVLSSYLRCRLMKV